MIVVDDLLKLAIVLRKSWIIDIGKRRVRVPTVEERFVRDVLSSEKETEQNLRVSRDKLGQARRLPQALVRTHHTDRDFSVLLQDSERTRVIASEKESWESGSRDLRKQSCISRTVLQVRAHDTVCAVTQITLLWRREAMCTHSARVECAVLQNV